MDEYRLSNPEGYELIEDYYLGEKVTHKELGTRHIEKSSNYTG